ncbi:MAG: DUF423 domain-containing protein [Gemmatimonadetes bacterium]|nr:DUF423 domain-containing protein [Gemmatimonadota bacterium]
MERQTRFFLLAGALNAGVAVGLGAFGAHALSDALSPRYLDIFETGVRYHFYHGLGLFVVAFASTRPGMSRLLSWAGRLMIAGIFFFSGSLYILALTQRSAFGAVTPIGGVCFLAGWACLAEAVRRS